MGHSLQEQASDHIEIMDALYKAYDTSEDPQLLRQVEAVTAEIGALCEAQRQSVEAKVAGTSQPSKCPVLQHVLLRRLAAQRSATRWKSAGVPQSDQSLRRRTSSAWLP